MTTAEALKLAQAPLTPAERRAYVLGALDLERGDLTRAARWTGRSRRTVERWIHDDVELSAEVRRRWPRAPFVGLLGVTENVTSDAGT
jgi:hypothetical protein